MYQQFIIRIIKFYKPFPTHTLWPKTTPPKVNPPNQNKTSRPSPSPKIISSTKRTRKTENKTMNKPRTNNLKASKMLMVLSISKNYFRWTLINKSKPSKTSTKNSSKNHKITSSILKPSSCSLKSPTLKLSHMPWELSVTSSSTSLLSKPSTSRDLKKELKQKSQRMSLQSSGLKKSSSISMKGTSRS